VDVEYGHAEHVLLLLVELWWWWWWWWWWWFGDENDVKSGEADLETDGSGERGKAALSPSEFNDAQSSPESACVRRRQRRSSSSVIWAGVDAQCGRSPFSGTCSMLALEEDSFSWLATAAANACVVSAAVEQRGTGSNHTRSCAPGGASNKVCAVSELSSPIKSTAGVQVFEEEEEEEDVLSSADGEDDAVVVEDADENPAGGVVAFDEERISSSGAGEPHRS